MTLSIRPADLAIAACIALAGIAGAGLVVLAFALWLRGKGIR